MMHAPHKLVTSLAGTVLSVHCTESITESGHSLTEVGHGRSGSGQRGKHMMTSPTTQA